MFELLRDNNLLELPDVVNCDLLYSSMPDVKNSALILSTALSINKSELFPDQAALLMYCADRFKLMAENVVLSKT